jgi:hypothetical protein
MLTSTAFWASAGERAIKTVAQTALALLGTSQLVSVVSVDWAEIGGVAVLAGILSLLTSIALPANETKASVLLEAAQKAAAASAPEKKAPAKAPAKNTAEAKKPGTTKK